jgi:hypothetical protein
MGEENLEVEEVEDLDEEEQERMFKYQWAGKNSKRIYFLRTLDVLRRWWKRIRVYFLRNLNVPRRWWKRIRIYSEEGSSTITMMPWFLYSDKAGLPKNPKIYPGAGIPCDNPSEVVFSRFEEITEDIKIDLIKDMEDLKISLIQKQIMAD